MMKACSIKILIIVSWLPLYFMPYRAIIPSVNQNIKEGQLPLIFSLQIKSDAWMQIIQKLKEHHKLVSSM